MGEQERWAEQQHIANEAANVLDKLVEGLGQIEQIGLHAYVATHANIVEASLTMMREVILQEYGLSKEPIVRTDMDDFVEFVVHEGNK
jgi:hypothetical protein